MAHKIPTICITREPITGFCYPFCRALLNKLISLAQEDNLFAKDGKHASENPTGQKNVHLIDNTTPLSLGLTPIADTVIRNICGQLRLVMITKSSAQQVGSFIDMVREFLDIFEKE
ncbi:MAG: hypothetical protein WC845_02920 [Candidatus Staskawiczbacteria bacterium]|jgi:hypothetical protein